MTKPVMIFVIESTSGGSKRHVVDLLLELSKRQYECILFYAVQRQDSRFPAELHELRMRGVRLIELNMTRSLSFTNVAAISTMSKHITSLYEKNKPIIIHGHSSIGGFVARGCKVILRLHGYDKLFVIYSPHSPITMDPTLSVLKRFMFTTIECIMGFITNQIIAVSKDESKHISRWPFCSSKTITIFNGIKTQDSLHPKHNAKIVHKKLLFVGRLSAQKDPLYAIEIMNHLPEYSLTIVGNGELSDEVREKVQSYDLKERIDLIGYSDQVSNFYESHVALLLTSKYEGFPYVVLEAMDSGCVIIGTDVPGLQGILEETGNIRIPLAHAEESASIIQKALNYTAAVNHMRDSNIGIVREKYGLNRMIDELENLYDRLSESTSSTRPAAKQKGND
jgi:glycosyltransferase involved in cell wall biosynthesis